MSESDLDYEESQDEILDDDSHDTGDDYEDDAEADSEVKQAPCRSVRDVKLRRRQEFVIRVKIRNGCARPRAFAPKRNGRNSETARAFRRFVKRPELRIESEDVARPVEFVQEFRRAPLVHPGRDNGAITVERDQAA